MTGSASQGSTGTTTLPDGSLVPARILWVAIVLLTAGVFIAAVLVRYTLLQDVCTAQTAVCEEQGLVTPEGVENLERTGLTLGFYATYMTVLTFVSLFVSWAVAATIFWHKSDDWLALLVALLLINFQDGSYIFALATAYPSWWLPVSAVQFVGAATLSLFYLFPNGQFVPGWTRWLAIIWPFYVFTGTFLRGSALDMETWPEWIFVPFWMGFLLSFVGAQIYRYRRISDSVQRKQTKWVVFGIAVAIVGFLAVVVLSESFPELTQPGSLQRLVVETITVLLTLGIPVSFGLAILKYRLYDIDILINRTLVYGSLTATLALVYLGSVVLLQRAFAPLIAQESTLAVVGSTLVIAALFQPLRRHLQSTIDRRFYRRKYDAQKTLESFALRLRNETNLETLTSDVLSVVEETLEPAHTSLWLRQPRREVKE